MARHGKKRREREAFRQHKMQAMTQFIHILEQWVGCRVEVSECMTRAAPSRDRHHSTTSTFSMELEHVSFWISGAQCVLLGVEEEMYALSIDSISEWNFEHSTQLHLTEHFSEQIERYTILSVL